MRRLDALGLPRAFLLYLGRVDKNNGCDQLFEYSAEYAAAHTHRTASISVRNAISNPCDATDLAPQMKKLAG